MSLLSTAVVLGKRMGLDPRRIYQHLSAASVDAAVREQGLQTLRDRLRAIRPDLTDQYTEQFDSAEYHRYWERKMRGLHAFQVQAALDALEAVGGDGLTVVDVGDSSGNHAAYIKALAPPGKVARLVSVNLDPVAVAKVNAKGGEAILARAEQLQLHDLHADLFLSFETVEHLTDPLRFLHRLAEEGSAGHLLMTVPYRRRSRFGGASLRQPEDGMPPSMTAEDVHIFELCPEDWLLLARLAGWSAVHNRRYLQYPRRSPLLLTAPLWHRLDFEGFWAVLLRRDMAVARRYAGW